MRDDVSFNHMLDLIVVDVNYSPEVLTVPTKKKKEKTFIPCAAHVDVYLVFCSTPLFCRQLAYHLLLAFEKIVAALPAVFIGTLASLVHEGKKASCPVISNLIRALQFPHSWVQLAASRCLGVLLALNDAKTARWKTLDQGSELGKSFLERDGVFPELLCSTLVQMQSLDRDETLSTQVCTFPLYSVVGRGGRQAVCEV